MNSRYGHPPNKAGDKKRFTMNYAVNISKKAVKGLLEESELFPDDLEEVLGRVKAVLSPAGIYQIYKEVTVQEDCFYISGRKFHCGRKIGRALAGSTSMAVFLITMGDGISNLIRSYNGQYEYLKAYWCDKLANWALDKSADKLSDGLKAVYKNRGLNLTSRWGPGYCEWPVTDQQPLWGLLPSNELHVSLSPAMLMEPVKSLSGVIGIGENVIYKKSGCADCGLKKCAYRSLKW